jgi:hypothetical protein
MVTGIKKENKKSAENYLDVGDNVHANVCNWLDSNCGDSDNRWFIPGTCEAHGHKYAKTIVCGKEWCPECSKKGSIAHNRRYVRWLGKIRQFKRMRYIVLTIPDSARWKYRSKVDLTELGRSAQIMMIKYGYKRGLRRWHWFGERSTVWNPHLNILVEGGYIKAETLIQIKIDWAGILNVPIQIERYENNKVKAVHGIDIKCEYKPTPADMLGCLFYVTRSTFHDYNWDIDMAMELRNFRNMVVWGRDWKQEAAWDLPAGERHADGGEVVDVASVEKLIEHTCPICNSKITWNKALPEKLLRLSDTLEIGAGYKYVVQGKQPVHLADDVKSNLHKMRMIWYMRTLGGVVIEDLKN